MSINKQVLIQNLMKIRGTIVHYSPEILTGLATAGVVGTVIATVKGTLVATTILEDMKSEQADFEYDETPEIPKKDVVKACWKCYIPAAIMGTTTVACIIGSNRISASRNAALSALYGLSEAAMKEYQDKVAEKFGEKKESEIRDEIAQDTLMKNPVDKNFIIQTGKGDTLCYDRFSGRYFMSDYEAIRKAQNDINEEIGLYCAAMLNQFYALIGLDDIPMGESIGWDIECPLRVHFASKLTTDNRPCVVVDFDMPKQIFGGLLGSY